MLVDHIEEQQVKNQIDKIEVTKDVKPKVDKPRKLSET